MDDLGGGLFLVTQDDDIELDDGPVGQLLHDAAPNLVIEVKESVSTLVEGGTQTFLVSTEQVLELVEDLEHPIVTEVIFHGPKGDTGPAGPSQEVHGQPLFVSAADPVTDAERYLWVQTGINGTDTTLWVEDGTV